MKQIRPSQNPQQWPRHRVESIECRKRDLVVRVADWTRDKEDPAYHVEVYVGGVYDGSESKSFTIHEHGTRSTAKARAVEFATTQITKLL